MTVKLMTKHHLELLSLKSGCTGLSESFHVKISHCSKSHFAADFNIDHCMRVRCTINRSHSTPCKKAEFEHLQTFPGHCLDFFLSVSGKICHSPIKKVKRQLTLIISFSQHSPFFGEQSKIRAEIRPASDVTWGVRRGVCDKIVHTKMHFSASA